MKQRENISSEAIWEEKVGYSRAVKVDDLIEISGTTAINESKVVAVGDPYEQTKFIINKFSSILEEAGSSLKDIIRVRIYVREITEWEKVGKAFFEYFKDIKPAATLVEVSSLIDPQLLVEMEATAIITERS
jgi:enamine deaminase RidA (YjgF/YER057c/UK114 family)